MQEKNLVNVWNETLSSRPPSRQTFRDMHLSVLHQATQRKLAEGLLHIQFEIHDFILCELKGRAEELQGFELPHKEEEILWLCIQFHGTLSFPAGSVSQPDTIFSFLPNDSENLLTVPAEKQWALFIGITGTSLPQLLAEQPLLRKQCEQQEKCIGASVPVSYADRHALDVFSKAALGTFSTLYHIGILLGKLGASYTQQVGKQEVEGKDEGLIVLYHQAVEYIMENYTDPDLNRMTISEALNCSTRSLSRAFEGRSVTLNSSILEMRLHKGRELLRKNPDLSIDYISGMLHFSTAKKFATHYKKRFHRTPREDRKAMLRSS